MLLRRCTDRLFLRPDGSLRGGRQVFCGKRLLLRARLPHRGRPARKKHPSRCLVPMNSAAWTAGQALPDQAFSREDPFKMSVYPRNQRISNKTNRCTYYYPGCCCIQAECRLGLTTQFLFDRLASSVADLPSLIIALAFWTGRRAARPHYTKLQ